MSPTPRSLVATPFVQVPPVVAALLEAQLPLSELRQRVRGQSPLVDDVLLGLRVLAMSFVEGVRPGSAAGTAVAAGPEPAVDLMTVSQVSDRVDVSDSAVRKAARQGRLRGEHVAGAWRFTRTDVDLWAASRTRKAA